MGQAKIEIFQKSDIEEILRIHKENNLASWLLQDYLDEIQRENSESFVAKKDEIVAGFIVSRLITTRISNSHDYCTKNNNQFKSTLESEIEIYNIAVDKKYQREGIGTSLIQKIIQIGMKRQVNSIWLEVRESNTAAISLYKRNKFKEIYRRKKIYTHPQEDASVMKLDFSDDKQGVTGIAKTET